MNPWDSWLDEHVTEVGVAEAISKCSPKIPWNEDYYRHVCYAHNLFGAPQFESWTRTPRNLIVSHPELIPVGDTTYFTVLVKDASTNSPLGDAKVCLNKTGDLYEVECTGSDGQVTFVIVPKCIGTIDVTVTRPHDADNNYAQYLPSQTACEVGEYRGGPQSVVSGETAPVKLSIAMKSSITENAVTIRFSIPVKGDVTIAIFNVLGSRVTAMRRDLLPGYYEEKMNTSENANGIYFAVLSQGDQKVSAKFLIIR
jgi:hypothetical protein